MHYKLIKNIVAALLAGLILSGSVIAQTSNKPGTQTQVSGPTQTVATAPGSYIVNGQSPLVNYVRERDGMGRITDTVQFAAAGYGDVQETTHYFDGLGRPLQTVQRQHSPGNSPVDMVAPVVYDPFGREVYKYLPYAAGSGNTTDGQFKQDPFTDQQNFYQNVYPTQQPALAGEQVYYGQTNYEASPLNRVLQTMAPGNNWAGSGNGVSQQYLTNTAADSVVIWYVGNDTLTYQNNDITTNIPTSAGYYSPGQLYKNVTLDEASHAVVEYKDKDGLVIVKKVQVSTVAGDLSGYTGWLSTYYIYDNLNQLRFVLSPKATNIIYGNGWNISADTTTISQLCFRYEYDSRLRMIAKKVPGAGWAYMVYDTRDRLVFSQDANMRGRNQWMATLYDGENRQTSTGMITYSGFPNQLQQYVTANTGSGTTGTVPITGSSPSVSVLVPNGLDLNTTENGDKQAVDSIIWDNGFVTPDSVNFTAEIVPAGTRDTTGGPGGVSFTDNVNVVDNPLPPGNNFIGLTMTFYDDYSNTSKVYTTVYNGNLDAGSNQHAEPYPAAGDAQAVQTIGLVTSTKVRVLENPNDLTQGNWLETANFYDDRARVVQTQDDNYKGGQDTMLTLHNFTSQAITTYLAHGNPAAMANNNTRIKTNIDLDFANRVLQVYETINDQDSTRRLLAQNTYDALGQLQTKQIGQTTSGSFLETQDYSYNIRGWVKGINRDYANNDNSRSADNRWFGEDLSYDWGFGGSQLNGNIAGEKWCSKGDGKQRAYGFGYDDANRLLFADFNQYGSGWDKSAGIDFSVTMGDGGTPNTAYDANGNILSMDQKGLLHPGAGSSQPIDQLRYSYNLNSNQLQNVYDSANNAATTLGDFRTDSLSPYFASKPLTAVDYKYDINGNLTRDLNKDIGSSTADGIIYNHLNLPWQITFRSATGTKGTITYIYDAAGNKLKKTTLDSAGNLQTVTTYIGAFQYQGRQALSGGIPADTLQFIGQEEGRVRLNTDTTGGQPVSSWKYDYFLKDHLGNTRMVLTDEQESDQYPAATMEAGDSSLENLYYTNLDETRVALPPGYPTDTTTKPNQSVAELYSADGNPVIGPGIVLKVMAGDQFSIKTSSWYQNNGAAPGQVVNPLTDVLSALIAGTAHIPGEGAAAGAMSNSPTLSPNVFNFLTDTGNVTIDQTKPHAFLNWILFDNQFNYMSASSGYQQVGASGTLDQMILTNLPVSASGFLYIYVSNTTPNVAVFFDNLQVTHTRGPLLEEDHYYPFGLAMAGISDKALKANYAENKYRFNEGNELQNKEFSDGSGLEWYDAMHRMYDPQIGRFGQIDEFGEASENLSPYSFATNDPIAFNDPVGLDTGTKKINLDPVVVTAHHTTQNLENTYWYYINNNISFDRIKDKGVRNWLYNYDDQQKYIQEVHSNLRTQGIIVANIASFLIPVGEIAQLARVGELVQLYRLKRGLAEVEVTTALVKAGLNISEHAAQRLAERGITEDMIKVAISKGAKFFDPKNKTINYVLKSGFASGKDLLIGTNPLTGRITTAIRGSNLISSRFIPL